MSSGSFGRRRERYSPKPAVSVKIGTLRKRNWPSLTVIQTIPVTSSTWPFAYNEATWDSIHKGPPFRSGGPFASIKAIADVAVRGNAVHRSPVQSPGFNPWIWEYQGGFSRNLFSWETSLASAQQSLAYDDPYEASLLNSLEALGPMAYDKLRPRIEEAGASVFIAELRDLGGMLKTSSAFFRGRWEALGGNRFAKTMAGSPKEASDHFLNHQFGWVPFISDLQKFYNVWQKQNAILQQKAKDNGMWVKRTRTISQDHSSTITRSGNEGGIPWRSEFNTMSTDLTPGTASRYRFEQETGIDTQIWANGQFTYYRPEFDLNRSDYESNWMQTSRLLSLYGARINPSFLWKVTPWTWLVDWFVGFGAWLDRLQSFGLDGVASRYMYMMKRDIKTVRHTVTINWNTGPQQILWINKYDTKQREEAGSPFGYSLPVGGLSPKQLAILAALGISRWF